MTNFKKMVYGFYGLAKRRFKPQTVRREPEREKLIYPFRMLIHPIAVFSDLKYEGRASMPLANVLLVLFILQRLLADGASGYLFSPSETSGILMVLATTLGLVVLWTVCNWAMCTLTDGEGKMREIWIATCYALLPTILFGFIEVGLTHLMSLDEEMIVTAVAQLGNIWTLLLIFVGVLVVHQYTVSKTLLTTLFTLVCMILVLFLIFLFFSVTQQLYGFISGLFEELSYW